MGAAGQAGGSLQLGELIDKHGDSLASDFERYTNYHLNDLFRPGSGLTPALALALIKNLPPESNFVADRRGGTDFRGWGADRYLMANMYDAIRILIYVTLLANGGKKNNVKAPEPVWRPEAVKKPAPNNPFRMHLEAAKRRKAKARGS